MSTFYIVATPIGNLEDITLSALRVLKEVDFIVCEDTRVTSKLLARYEIKKPLVSYFQHSRLSRVEEILGRLARGESAALVTDAGTPGISDPGGKLIMETLKQGNMITIVPIPGPAALTAALSISGLPADKFVFMGFPPHKKGRPAFWRRVVECEETVVFYESPHRILKSLEQLRDAFCSPPPQSSPLKGEEEKGGILKSKGEEEKGGILPSRDEGEKENSPPLVGGVRGGGRHHIVVCRELTKMFESVYRGTIEEVIEKVQKDPVKGEYVVVVGK